MNDFPFNNRKFKCYYATVDFAWNLKVSSGNDSRHEGLKSHAVLSREILLDLSSYEEQQSITVSFWAGKFGCTYLAP